MIIKTIMKNAVHLIFTMEYKNMIFTIILGVIHASKSKLNVIVDIVLFNTVQVNKNVANTSRDTG